MSGQKFNFIKKWGLINGDDEKNYNMLIYLREKSGLHPRTITKSPIFSIQLQNRITKDIQLLKPDKFDPLAGFEGFSILWELKIFNFKLRNS